MNDIKNTETKAGTIDAKEEMSIFHFYECL